MTVAAILSADWHLSLKAPVARSAEPSWLNAQARPLKQLRELAEEHGCPVVVAGDIFDRWNSPPELINWAVENMPTIHAVPGNHDLPMHEYKALNRSAYRTLVKAGRIVNLPPGGTVGVGKLLLTGFPHGFRVRPPKKTHSLCPSVAVVHAYIWMTGHSYPQADEGGHFYKWAPKLEGYGVALFGDNHIGFKTTVDDRKIVNPGTLMRRKTDERDYKPFVGLLHDDGSVEKHHLDCSEDRWADADLLAGLAGDGIDAADFLAELERLGDRDELDFREQVLRFLRSRKISKKTRRTVLEILEVANAKI